MIIIYKQTLTRLMRTSLYNCTRRMTIYLYIQLIELRYYYMINDDNITQVNNYYYDKNLIIYTYLFTYYTGLLHIILLIL